LKLGDIYKVVADRERLCDRLAWQLPAIVFTAAAIFLTIITDADRTPWARLWSGLALFVVGLGFAFVLLRIRKGALLDSEWLHDAVSGSSDLYSPHGKVWALNRSEITFREAFPRIWAAVFGLWLSMCLVALVGYVSIFSILALKFHAPWAAIVGGAAGGVVLLVSLGAILHDAARQNLKEAWIKATPLERAQRRTTVLANRASNVVDP
jgi:hypothetical protein